MLELGQMLQSRYVVENRLGQGGMGTVYGCRQSLLGRRKVAIKEINVGQFSPGERTEVVISFLREAETLAHLSHPYLVNVLDCFTEDDKLYLVMEQVEGCCLEDLLEEHPAGMDVSVALEWARQLCTVLTYLHTSRPRVIFRDLKPGNIIIDEHNTVRLIDFGIASRALESSGADDIPPGTPGYAPIEQLTDMGIGPNPRFDIYGLGATLYHILTGERPLDALGRLCEEINAPVHLNPAVPHWLSEGVMKMMSLQWDERFPSALSVRQWLDAQVLEPMREGHDEQPDMAPGVLAWWQDGNCLYDLRITSLTEDVVTFHSAPSPNGGVPSELIFQFPQLQQPVRVAVHLLKLMAQGLHYTCEARLVDVPHHVMRMMRLAFAATAPNSVQRRRHDRVSISLDVSLPARLGMGFGLDLSMSGLRVCTPQPLPVGARLALSLRLRDNVLPDLEATAEVRWCRACWGGGYESGMQFTRLPLQMQHVLELYLERVRALA